MSPFLKLLASVSSLVLVATQAVSSLAATPTDQNEEQSVSVHTPSSADGLNQAEVAEIFDNIGNESEIAARPVELAQGTSASDAAAAAGAANAPIANPQIGNEFETEPEPGDLPGSIDAGGDAS